MADTLVTTITRAVRRADDRFAKSGGSSRHWVRDCFLDELEAEGLTIIESAEITRRLKEREAMCEWLAQTGAVRDMFGRGWELPTPKQVGERIAAAREAVKEADHADV